VSNDTDLLEMLDLPFEFQPQPVPIPASLRPERRVSLLVMLIARSFGTRASWRMLQVMNWLLRDERNVQLLLALRSGGDIPDRPLVRFEPALDRAIDVAMGLGFVTQKASRVFHLTESGLALAAQLNTADVFSREKELLQRLGGKFTQKEIDRLIEWREQ
jgi:hypothetical protein